MKPIDASVMPSRPKYSPVTIATRMAEPFWANMTAR